ncbi:MAG: hypothetical protein IT270_03565, partial [Saprospiraceae bacterium]|nr:hypothetical protein [Saprospiraceae bacterium]
MKLIFKKPIIEKVYGLERVKVVFPYTNLDETNNGFLENEYVIEVSETYANKFGCSGTINNFSSDCSGLIEFLFKNLIYSLENNYSICIYYAENLTTK